MVLAFEEKRHNFYIYIHNKKAKQMDLRMKITIPFELFKHNIIDWDNGVVHKIQKSDPI